MKRVKITVKGLCKGFQGKNEEITFSGEGNYGYRGDYHFIRYEDDSIFQGKLVKTTIKVGQDDLILLRQGIIETRQAFIPNKVTQANYKTPYGTFLLWMDTKELKSTFQEDKGEITFRYVLGTEKEKLGRYTLKITVESIADEV